MNNVNKEQQGQGTRTPNDNTQTDWNRVRGKIKQRWAKLSDDDIDYFNGKLDAIAGKLQEKYGYSRDEAEQELASFKKTLH